MNDEVVVFDLDGVLLDSESDLGWLHRAYRKALEELGVPPSGRNLEKLSPDEVDDLEGGVEDFPAPASRVWEVRDKYYVAEKVKLIERGQLRPFPDVGRLESLAEEFPLGLVSNTPTEVVESFLREYGLTGLFRGWVGRETGLEGMRKMKPDPHMFSELDREMGGGEYWYVGDRESDAEFARRTGMNFLFLTRDGEGYGDLAEVVDYFL